MFNYISQFQHLLAVINFEIGKTFTKFTYFFLFATIFSILGNKCFAQMPSGIGQRFKNMGQQVSGKKTSTPTHKSSILKPRIKKDTLSRVIPDSLRSLESSLTTTVETYSADSTVLNVPNKIYELYGDAQVIYGDIQLKAEYIRLDWNKNEVYAHGLPDSTKKVGSKVKGKPIFIDRGEEYNSDTIRYNFKSKKAIVSDIVTVQGDGFVQGAKVKKDAEDNMYLAKAKYTTCNLEDPHFYISAKKIKLVNKKSLVSGPFNIVVADVPLPIGLPFGFFPIPKKKEIGTSGFVMGNYGQDPNFRGFYFRDFGYYHAFNEYIGAKVLAQIYTNGSYGASVQSNYTKRYKYNGNVNLQFNNNKSGEIFGGTVSKDFRIGWSHSPQSLRSDRSFSASLNVVSSKFNQNNSALSNVSQYSQSATNSAVQATRNFGKLVRTSVSLNGSQNVVSKVFNAGINYNFGLNQVNPFVSERKQTGKWYDSFRLGLDVTGGYKVDNSVTTKSNVFTEYNLAGVYNKPYTSDDEREIARLNALLLDNSISSDLRATYQEQLKKLQPTVLTNLSDILNKSQFTTSYSVPISLPNIKIAKFINLTPNISYRGEMFSKKINYQFVNPDQGKSAIVTLHNGKTVTIYNDPTLSKSDSVRIEYQNDGSHINMLETIAPNSGGVVVADTVKGAYFPQSFAFGAGLNTRVYGTYRFNSKSRIQAIRHTLSPSLGVSYTPATSDKLGYAALTTTRQYFAYSNITKGKDSLITTQKYLPQYIGGSSTNNLESMNISFGLSNQLEAKVRSKSDTALSEFSKIMLLDNFGVSGSFNPLANTSYQSKLSNLNFSANNNLFKGLISINGNATLDPYKYYKDSVVTSNISGIRSYTDLKEINWVKRLLGKDAQGGDFGSWIPQYNFSVNTHLSPKTFNKESAKPKVNDPAREAMDRFVRANPMDYVDFNIPWSLNISYTFSYNRQGLQPKRYDPSSGISKSQSAKNNTRQALMLSGDFSLSSKMKITYNTGWDFQYKAVTLTNLSILRELHCWDMSLTWTPIYGNNIRTSNYSFTLKPRSSLLADMKLSRRRYNTTNGGF